MMFPKPAVLAVLAFILAASADAQVVSPPPICFSFNDAAPLPFGLPTVAIGNALPGDLGVFFTCPVSSTIDRLDLWKATGSAWNFVLRIVETATGTTAGSYSTQAVFSASGWQACATTAAASLSAGTSYVLFVQAVPMGTTSCWSLPYDPAPVSPLSYQLTGPTPCPGAIAPTGQLGLIVRFRGASCGFGPPASVQIVGATCGVGVTLTLNSSAPPAYNTNWPLVLFTQAPSSTAYVFWAAGVYPAGLPVVPGSSCLHYLDPVSLTAFASASLEPLVSAILPPPPLGLAAWTFPIPGIAYAGATAGLQALVVTPAGTIPLGGGTFGALSNALLITIGY
jgi:hypothetical protein